MFTVKIKLFCRLCKVNLLKYALLKFYSLFSLYIMLIFFLFRTVLLGMFIYIAQIFNSKKENIGHDVFKEFLKTKIAFITNK